MAFFLSPTSPATMSAGFPQMVAKIIGEPTLQELIRALNTHLIPCDQSHVTTSSTLNLLYICIPENIYAQYTNEPYPDPPTNPGNWDSDGKNTALGRTAAKVICDKLHRDFWDEANMNRVLITKFLALLDSSVVQSFQEALLTNQNMAFGNVFQ